MLLMTYLLQYPQKIYHQRWRFWVLKYVHYLQDYVIIRKKVEKKGLIKREEKWLSEEYIKANSKNQESIRLLDTLEIFEYAYQKLYVAYLPQSFDYSIALSRVVLSISFALSAIILFVTLILKLDTIKQNLFFYQDYLFLQILYMFSDVLFIILPIFLIAFLCWKMLFNLKYFFSKTVLLSVNSKKIITKKFLEEEDIYWKDIEKISLVYSELQAQHIDIIVRIIIFLITFTISFTSNSKKRELDFSYEHSPHLQIQLKGKYHSDFLIKIRLNHLNRDAKKLFEEVNDMFEQYKQQHPEN